MSRTVLLASMCGVVLGLNLTPGSIAYANSEYVEDFPGLYFYRTSLGEEVAVHINGNRRHPEYVFDARLVPGRTGYDLVRDFVRSALAREVYIYEIVHTCPDPAGCESPLGPTTNAFGPAIQAKSKKKTVDDENDIAYFILEELVREGIPRLFDALTDALTSDATDVESSNIQINWTSSSGQFAGMCQLLSDGICEPIQEVEFRNVDPGVEADFPVPIVGTDDFDFHVALSERWDRFIRARRYTCESFITSSSHGGLLITYYCRLE